MAAFVAGIHVFTAALIYRRGRPEQGRPERLRWVMLIGHGLIDAQTIIGSRASGPGWRAYLDCGKARGGVIRLIHRRFRVCNLIQIQKSACIKVTNTGRILAPSPGRPCLLCGLRPQPSPRRWGLFHAALRPTRVGPSDCCKECPLSGVKRTCRGHHTRISK
jgi:hypothetical protein